MMEHRREVDTQTRLYQQGVDKQRKINESEHQRKVESQMHSQYKTTTITSEAKEGHRGLPTGMALYTLGQEKLKKQEEKKRELEEQLARQANSKFKNKESDALRISAFKREFRIRLSQILGSEVEIDPKEQVLDFNLAA